MPIKTVMAQPKRQRKQCRQSLLRLFSGAAWWISRNIRSAFYNSVADNLKNAAKTATESINNITDSFNNGGLNEAIQTAGDEFANLVVEAASHAPEMVDTAVDFIEAFASGIASNKGRILGAAGEMAESMASGLAELLPSKLQEPVEDAIDAVAESLSDGGLEKQQRQQRTPWIM